MMRISTEGGASAPPSAARASPAGDGLGSIAVVVLGFTFGEDIGGDVGIGLVGCASLVDVDGWTSPGVRARGELVIGGKRPGGKVIVTGSLGCMFDLVSGGGLITASAAVTCPVVGGVSGLLVGELVPTSVKSAGLGGG